GSGSFAVGPGRDCRGIDREGLSAFSRNDASVGPPRVGLDGRTEYVSAPWGASLSTAQVGPSGGAAFALTGAAPRASRQTSNAMAFGSVASSRHETRTEPSSLRTAATPLPSRSGGPAPAASAASPRAAAPPPPTPTPP